MKETEPHIHSHHLLRMKIVIKMQKNCTKEKHISKKKCQRHSLNATAIFNTSFFYYQNDKKNVFEIDELNRFYFPLVWVYWWELYICVCRMLLLISKTTKKIRAKNLFARLLQIGFFLFSYFFFLLLFFRRSQIISNK